MLRKRLNATIEAATDQGIIAKITTDSIDRDGEVLVPQGMNSKDFENNPVLFWNHDYSQPVGNVTNIERGDRAVFGTLNFAKRTEGVKGEFFPEVAESLVRQGIVKGVSVGFVPEGNGSRSASTKDRKQYGDGCKRVFNRWKLLEVSIAPLPANQDALIQAVDKGLLSPVMCKSMFGFDVTEAKRHSIRLAAPAKRHTIQLCSSRKKAVAADTNEEVAAMVARLRGTLYL